MSYLLNSNFTCMVEPERGSKILGHDEKMVLGKSTNVRSSILDLSPQLKVCLKD